MKNQLNIVKHGMTIALIGALVGCGGGGGVSVPSPTPVAVTPPAPTPVPAPVPPPLVVYTAILTSQADNKLQWEIATPLAITLKDAAGTSLSGTLTCTSGNAVAIEVEANCASAKIKRIGAQTITVSNGTASAALAIKGIPQRQPLLDRNDISTRGAVTSDGVPWLWGNNFNGQLGQIVAAPLLEQSALPVQPEVAPQTPMTNIASMSVGDGGFALALTEDGEIWSWGGGPLGRGTINSQITPGKVRNTANTGSLTNVVQVSAGSTAGLALLDDGSVLAWGTYVGQGPSANGAFPNKVQFADGTFLSNAVQVSGGRAVGFALTRSGRVFAWGNESDSMAGGTATSSGSIARVIQYATPVVDGITLAPLTGIVSIATGGFFNNYALTNAGNVYSWGRQSAALGQQVQSSFIGGAARAALVKGVLGTGVLSGIKSISAGFDSAYALTATGDIFAWGESNNAQLGEGNTVNVVNGSDFPRKVISITGTGDLTGMKAIGGAVYGAVALAPTGDVLNWGADFVGNTGQNRTFGPPPRSIIFLRIPSPVKAASGAGNLNLGNLNQFKNLARTFPAQ